MSILKPSDPNFWTRDIEQVTKNVVGERVITNNRILVIEVAEAFRSLIRNVMSEDFDGSSRREPGDIFITQFRGAPLVNVTGRVDRAEPEVVWLKQMRERGTKKVTGSALAKSVAESEGIRLLTKKALLDYCLGHLDGKNVNDPNSPIRIVENIDQPPGKRHVSFGMGGNADNSEGIAVLNNPENGINTPEQAKLILAQEARRLGVSVNDLLNPNKAPKYMKKSQLLRKVLEFFA